MPRAKGSPALPQAVGFTIWHLSPRYLPFMAIQYSTVLSAGSLGLLPNALLTRYTGNLRTSFRYLQIIFRHTKILLSLEINQIRDTITRLETGYRGMARIITFWKDKKALNIIPYVHIWVLYLSCEYCYHLMCICCILCVFFVLWVLLFLL
jgi:hypothetical protein